MPGGRDDDELVGGSPRDPLRVPPWAKVLGAVAVLSVLGLVAGRSLGHDGAPAPPGSPSPTASASRSSGASGESGESTAPASNPLLTDVAGPLSAPDLCVSTDQRTLTVLFTLENTSLARVTVLSVSAELPIGGLTATHVGLPARESCRAVAGAGRDLVLRPGAKVPVALHFRLPPECPAPYPVFAHVAFVGNGETPASQQIPLLADLGGYDFTSCERQLAR